MTHLSDLFDALSYGERVSLNKHIQDVVVRQGEILLQAGEPIEYVWFPVDFVASALIESPDGATIEVGLMGFEGLVGTSLVFGVNTNNATVIAQVPGRARRMTATAFRHAIVEPEGEAFRIIMRYTNAYMSMVAQTAACNAMHQIEQRLARWILMVSDRRPGRDLPLTQEFISYMLGVRRASVSVAANALQQKELISYSRGIIRVLNRSGLEHHCCACYRAVCEMFTALTPRAASSF